MARKAYNGYTEKSYYDNTKFYGVVATTDPLNEGNFRELINYDIEDTGASLKPRQGFLTTALHDINNDVLNLNVDKTLIYDCGNNEYLFILLSPFCNVDISTEDIVAYKYKLTDINVSYNGYMDELEFYEHDYTGSNNDDKRADYSYELIRSYTYNKIDIKDDLLQKLHKDTIKIHNNLGFSLSSSSTLSGNTVYQIYPISINDDTGITITYYVSVVYNKLKDRIVIGELDYNQQFDITNINLASDKSIIPVPYQTILDESRPSGFIDKFNIIYTRQNNKHTTTQISKNTPVDIIPSFSLDNTNNDDGWSIDEYSSYIDIKYETVSDLINEGTLQQELHLNNLKNFSINVKQYTIPNDSFMFMYRLYNTSGSEEDPEYLSPIFKLVSSNGDIINYSRVAQGALSKLADTLNIGILYDDLNIYKAYHNLDNVYDDCIFEYVSNEVINGEQIDKTLMFKLNEYSSNPAINGLKDRGYFENGISIEFYIIKNHTQLYVQACNKLNDVLSKEFKSGYDVIHYDKILPIIDAIFNSIFTSHFDPDYLVTGAYLMQSINKPYAVDDGDITYLEDVNNEYSKFSTYTDALCFDDMGQHRLVVWGGRDLYISETVTEDVPGFFTSEKKKEFPEDIVKVLQFRDLLLVFTVQSLYVIYNFTDTRSEIKAETDSDGNTTNKLVTTEVNVLAQMKVLYNIMCGKHYADTIQIFNQMILFYSVDGQLYLIKPSSTIDNDTRFTVTYFNRGVNDVLLNYDKYIQDRLDYLNIKMTDHGYDHDDVRKEDIKIKSTVTINHIKIYYCIPNIITYILIYDVVNNYWKIYDTTVMTNINAILFINGTELYIDDEEEMLYLTKQYKEPFVDNSNSDMTFLHNYQREAIDCLIDTGTLNLNNHLRKRFRTLHLTYKNLTALDLGFKLDVIADDMLIQNNIYQDIEVREINGNKVYVVSDKQFQESLIDKNIVLDYTNFFNISEFNSSKILTQKSSIPCIAKTIRFKLHLVSKGVYKINSYGIIYKERTV